METFTKVKEVLKNREVTILSMEKNLNRSSSLNRLLLDALSKSIGSSDLLSYDERQAIKTETKDLCKGIDTEMSLQEALINNDNTVKPVGKIEDLDY
tara:strand:+ start:1270 stop:1560 length:291 start_codon:yes stop_codon:yes gene_type:complete